MEEFEVPSLTPYQKGIQIIGAAEDYDVKNVNTKVDDEISDSHISEMTMFIFKKDGNILQGYSDVACSTPVSSAINIQKSNPTFLIDTDSGILSSLGEGNDFSPIYYDNEATDIGECSIYIVANAWHQLKSNIGAIGSLDDLQDQVLTVDATLDMPKNINGSYIGFPMIGTHNAGGTAVTFNLKQGGSNTHSVATIPLKKLYSKVRFRMQVNSRQVVTGGQVPKFKLDKVEVYNVPTMVRMGYKSGDYVTNIGQYRFTGSGEDKPFTIVSFDKTVINHSSSATTDDYLEFGFYMPEHMVTSGDIAYPANITEEAKQYYKPKGAEGKIATFVRIYGVYTDHNGQIKEVKYDVYLGQNQNDDFEVKRNQQLNNYLTITGVTNHKDAYPDIGNSISIDHRVEVTSKGFNLSIEREALLDSHFEVRPLDIELQPGSSITVVIPDEYRSWIAMESDAVARDRKDTDLYINITENRKGVRKFFTTNLVTELTEANSGTIKVSHSGVDDKKAEIHRIWFYIDENLNVYDKTVTDLQTGDSGYTVSPTETRQGRAEFYYAENGDPDVSVTPNAIVNFQQWNLYRVWDVAGQYYYDIEHEEEYLNNYASDQGYGETQNGMPWGLDGTQLSYIHDSFTCNEANPDWTNFINANPIKYDFYIGKHDDDNENSDLYTNDGGTLHNFAGQEFTKEIAENPNAAVEYLTLGEQAESAVQYCYSKNKRNTDGSVDVKWYLPSADELEDFIVAAYSDFKEFQDNYYWTSQPAYIRNAFYYEYFDGTKSDRNREDTYVFIVYEDNKTHARATKVAYINGKYDYVPSGLNRTSENATIDCNNPICKDTYFNVMYGWYRWTESEWSWSDFQYHTVTRTQEKIGNNAMTADEHYNEYIDGSNNGVRYHVELGHLKDLIQKTEGGEHGYHERTKKNRVRCVRVAPE